MLYAAVIVLMPIVKPWLALLRSLMVFASPSTSELNVFCAASNDCLSDTAFAAACRSASSAASSVEMACWMVPGERRCWVQAAGLLKKPLGPMVSGTERWALLLYPGAVLAMM